MFGLLKKPTAQPHRLLRACNVYCCPVADRVIVASVYDRGGLWVEKPGGALIVDFSDAGALNAAIRKSLDSYEYREDLNYSIRNKSDWPAYQVSGCKTLKRFEAEYLSLLVRAVNERNLFYEVTSPELGEFGLHLAITVNAYTGNHGVAIQYIVRKFLACKASIEGIV